LPNNKERSDENYFPSAIASSKNRFAIGLEFSYLKFLYFLLTWILS